jgi:hypothetical protein
MGTIILPEINPQALRRGFKSIPATPQTAAWDYLTGKRNLEQVACDPRALGAFKQADGIMIVFKDGSSILKQDWLN